MVSVHQREQFTVVEWFKPRTREFLDGSLYLNSSTCTVELVEGYCRNPFFFCCSLSFVVGSLKDEQGRRVSE